MTRNRHRALETYLKKVYSEEWVHQRLLTIRIRNELKCLKKENLRDNMSDLELILTMLAKASTTDISKTAKPQGFSQNQQVDRQGGEVAGITRQALEARTASR